MREFLVRDGGLSGPLADWLLMNTERDPSGGVRWRIDASRLRAFHDEAIREDFWPSVQKAGVPIHCIRGGKSSFVSDEDAARWERLGSRVSTVANAGHYLHVDAPELLLEILLSAS
jgi:pimeloyl-ACP methyl ester carboxylesterase